MITSRCNRKTSSSSLVSASFEQKPKGSNAGQTVAIGEFSPSITLCIFSVITVNLLENL